MLTAFTGSPLFGASVTIRAGGSGVEPGHAPAVDVTLTWPTFDEAAVEAGLSRRYGGIHFESADLASRAMGAAIGRLVWQNVEQRLGGRPRRRP